MDVEADGISFNAETVEAVRITEDAEYEGVRVRVHQKTQFAAKPPAPV